MPKKKDFLGNKFSTLDVSCSCPLCSIGSHFGEAWVLLSNHLSCLQMKVSGEATHKKLLSPFWSGQIVFRQDSTKQYFVHKFKPCLVKKGLYLFTICPRAVLVFMYSQSNSMSTGEEKAEQIFWLLSSVISDERRQPQIKPTDSSEVN